MSLFWKKVSLLLVLLCVNSAWAGCAQFFPPSDLSQADFEPALATLVRSIDAAILASGGTQGISITIVYDQTTVFSRGWGTEDGVTPITEHIPFLVASVTKLVTALAMLVKRDKVDLNAPLSRYVKNCPPCQFTFRQLSTHTSGLPTDPPCGVLTQNCNTTTQQQVAAIL